MLVMALKSGACDLTLEEASALRHQCNQFLFLLAHMISLLFGLTPFGSL
jgi:hypothetical protein